MGDKEYIVDCGGISPEVEPTNMDEVAAEIVAYLRKLPEGTELATSDVIETLYGHKYLACGDYEIHGELFGFEDFFKLDYNVRKLARKRCLILDDSKYADMVTGLPYNIPYVVRRRVKKREINIRYTDETRGDVLKK